MRRAAVRETQGADDDVNRPFLNREPIVATARKGGGKTRRMRAKFPVVQVMGGKRANVPKFLEGPESGRGTSYQKKTGRKKVGAEHAETKKARGTLGMLGYG